jgi:hypothetical protein
METFYCVLRSITLFSMVFVFTFTSVCTQPLEAKVTFFIGQGLNCIPAVRMAKLASYAYKAKKASKKRDMKSLIKLILGLKNELESLTGGFVNLDQCANIGLTELAKKGYTYSSQEIQASKNRIFGTPQPSTNKSSFFKNNSELSGLSCLSGSTYYDGDDCYYECDEDDCEEYNEDISFEEFSISDYSEFINADFLNELDFGDRTNFDKYPGHQCPRKMDTGLSCLIIGVILAFIPGCQVASGVAIGIGCADLMEGYHVSQEERTGSKWW